MTRALKPNKIKWSARVYVVEIVNRETKKRMGPTIFTGDFGEPTSLVDARAKAERWIQENTESPEDWCVVSRIVGCL